MIQQINLNIEKSLQGVVIPQYYNTTISSVNFSSIQMQVLVVAGGGGGASGGGTGGGGAGGLVYNPSYTTTLGQSFSVTVGTGGVANASGTNSVFGLMTANGGGGGATNGGGSFAIVGGSGGGGGYYQENPGLGLGATGNQGNSGGGTGYGNAGGNGTVGGGSPFTGGGGGGAGGVGANGVSNGGNGGVGLLFSISGTATYYAGGGAGSGDAAFSGSGTGGLGGGGNGTSANGQPGIAGTPNTGGGGGAGGQGTGAGGIGGSGIVIISYVTLATGDGTGGTIIHSNGYTIHTFTSSGIFTSPPGTTTITLPTYYQTLSTMVFVNPSTGYAYQEYEVNYLENSGNKTLTLIGVLAGSVVEVRYNLLLPY